MLGMTRIRVLGCVHAVTAYAVSGCSNTSAPSRPSSSPTPTSATATSPQSSLAGPSCGTPIPGRHRYLPSPPAANAILLLGTGPRGIVLGAQANGGICQILPTAQRLQARGYHIAVFDWGTDYATDMTRATHAVLSDGARRVILGGFSRGALVGLGIAPP